MSYPRIYQKVFCEPWLIEPSAHDAIVRALTGDSRLPDQYVNDWGELRDITYYSRHSGGIARIPISGIIGKHISLMESLCGGYDLAFGQKALEKAMLDDEVTSIVLDIDSPGGTVTGVPEFAAMVRRVRSEKPVYAFTETLMASAAMWIGSQAQTIFATPSARVGSIGVYRTWIDESAAMAMDGLKRELFEAGAHKAIGLRPITDAEREIIQAEVERIHSEFKAAVNMQREVPEEAMQGLVYTGEQAQQFGLVDFFVDCWTDLVNALNEI